MRYSRIFAWPFSTDLHMLSVEVFYFLDVAESQAQGSSDSRQQPKRNQITKEANEYLVTHLHLDWELPAISSSMWLANFCEKYA